MRAVWLQSPSKAGLYQAVGVNQFVGLWDGTVEADPKDGPILPLLRQYNMPFSATGESALAGPDAARHLSDPIIDAGCRWTSRTMRSRSGGRLRRLHSPSAIISNTSLKAADPKRPVYLGLGQGTGYNSGSCYYGRGWNVLFCGARISTITRCTFRAATSSPATFIRRMTRTRSGGSAGQRTVCAIGAIIQETGPSGYRVGELRQKPFRHADPGGGRSGGLDDDYSRRARPSVFRPPVCARSEEDSILHPEHADVKAAVARTNIQVAALARVLNTPSVGNGVSVTSSSAHAAINVLLKRYGGCTFLLAINDGLPQNQTPSANPIEETSLFCRGSSPCTDSIAKAGGALSMSPAGATTATFALRDFPAHATAIELREKRQIPVSNGVFSGDFATSYAWHLYQILFDPNPRAALLGDVNGDGKVDASDVLIVKAAMGSVAGQPGYDPRADVIRDGTVDSADLAIVEEAVRRSR